MTRFPPLASLIKALPMTVPMTVIAAGLFGASLPAAAQAATAGETRSRLVTYSDLDLATAQGQDALDARLRRAAARVCPASPGPHPLAADDDAQACYRQALEQARAQFAALGKGPARHAR